MHNSANIVKSAKCVILPPLVIVIRNECPSPAMRLSTNTRYAIRIIFELHLANAPIPIAALSEQTNISQKTVESIHAILKQNGITEAIIGAHGGIRLCKPLREISLGKMIDLFDDGVRFVVCFGNKSNDCPRQHICETRSVWKTVSDRISDVLEGVSLESILDQYRQETDRERGEKIVIRCINRKGDIPL